MWDCEKNRIAVMGQGKSKHIGEAHAVTTHHPSHTDVHDVHHPKHTGHEGVGHHLMDWSDELFNRHVQEGDTLWHLSQRYLGDGTQWPYLQSACELDRDPHYLLPGRPITHHCINKAKEEARHHHHKSSHHHGHSRSHH